MIFIKKNYMFLITWKKKKFYNICSLVPLELHHIFLIYELDNITLQQTRPDTWLPQSCADGQGLYLRSLYHLGRSNEAKDYKNQKKNVTDHGPTNQRTDLPTDWKSIKDKSLGSSVWGTALVLITKWFEWSLIVSNRNVVFPFYP